MTTTALPDPACYTGKDAPVQFREIVGQATKMSRCGGVVQQMKLEQLLGTAGRRRSLSCV